MPPGSQTPTSNFQWHLENSTKILQGFTDRAQEPAVQPDFGLDSWGPTFCVYARIVWFIFPPLHKFHFLYQTWKLWLPSSRTHGPKEFQVRDHRASSEQDDPSGWHHALSCCNRLWCWKAGGCTVRCCPSATSNAETSLRGPRAGLFVWCPYAPCKQSLQPQQLRGCATITGHTPANYQATVCHFLSSKREKTE